MQKIGFSEALDKVLQKHPEYDREAYQFLREGLEFTVKLLKKERKGVPQHVNAGELCDGLRQFAIKEYGPMVPVVFQYWGVKSSADLGRMVFNLIEVGIFGKTDTDRVEDFAGVLDFHKAFVEPFAPRPAGRGQEGVPGAAGS